MAVRNQKTQKMDMYVKIYKENYQFLNTSVYNDIRIKYTHLSLLISNWSLRQKISLRVCLYLFYQQIRSCLSLDYERYCT
jgi:hypothetical protein